MKPEISLHQKHSEQECISNHCTKYFPTSNYKTYYVDVFPNIPVPDSNTDIRNVQVKYVFKNKEKYHETSGSTLVFKTPELIAKPGCKVAWNKNLVSNMINSYYMSIDDVKLHEGDRNILRKHLHFNNSEADYEFGNRNWLTEFSNHVISDEISFTFPWPYSAKYYCDTAKAHINPFPLYAFGDRNEIAHHFSFNLHPDSLITCIDQHGNTVKCSDVFDVVPQIPIPHEVTVYQVVNDIEANDRFMNGKKDHEVIYLTETYVFDEGEATKDFESGTPFSKSLESKNVIEIFWCIINKELTKKCGTDIYYYKNKEDIIERIVSTVKFDSKEERFDLTGLTTEVIIPRQTCKYTNFVPGFGLFKNDIGHFDEPNKPKATFNITDGNITIFTKPSDEKNRLVGRVYIKKYISLWIQMEHNNQKERTNSKSQTMISDC